MISKAPVSSLLFLPLSLPPNSLLFSISVFLFSFPHSPHLFFLNPSIFKRKYYGDNKTEMMVFN